MKNVWVDLLFNRLKTTGHDKCLVIINLQKEQLKTYVLEQPDCEQLVASVIFNNEQAPAFVRMINKWIEQKAAPTNMMSAIE